MSVHRLVQATLIFVAGISSSLSSHAQPAALPLLTCNAQSTTPAVVPPAQVRDVLNTYAAGFVDNGYTYPNNSQPLWSAGTELLNATGDATTGVLSPSSPYGYDAPPTVPALASGWIPLGDPAVTNFIAPYAVGLNGASKPNVNPNVMYFFRFQFMMDPQADPARFGLSFTTMAVDDRLRGIYVNGQRVRATEDQNNLALNVSDTSLLPPAASFKTGLNEIVWAVLNVGDPGNPPTFGSSYGNPSMVAFRLGGASVTDCAPTPTITAPAVPPGIITPTTPMSYTGTVTHWGSATTVDILLGDADATQLLASYKGTIDQSLGRYTLVNAPQLATGRYVTLAQLKVPPGPGGGSEVDVVSELTAFSVIGITMNALPDIKANTPQLIIGAVQNPSSATTVNVSLANQSSAKSYGPYPATIQPDDSYRVTTPALPVGNYLATATIPGAAGVQASSPFKVTALPVPVAKPVPALGAWALGLLAAAIVFAGLILGRESRST